MPLIRLLIVLVPTARRLLPNPAVRAKRGLDSTGAKSGRRATGRKR